MTIYIKNVNTSHERMENFLNQLVGEKNWQLLKDTYKVVNSTKEQYEQVIEFKDELMDEEGSSIIVSL